MLYYALQNTYTKVQKQNDITAGGFGLLKQHMLDLYFLFPLSVHTLTKLLLPHMVKTSS